MKHVSLLFLIVLTFSLIVYCGGKKENVLQETRTPEQLLQEGDLLFAQGQYQKALDTYQRLLIFYPTSELDIDAKLRMAKCYNKMEKYEKQMDILLGILKENLIPEKVPAIYVQIGKYYEEAARFNPFNSDTSDYKTAIQYYQRAIKYEDSNDQWSKAEAKYRLGIVYAKMGQFDLAREAYESVISENPETPFAILAQVKLQKPNDISELSTLPDSIETYKNQLGSLLKSTEVPTEIEEEGPSLDEYINNPNYQTDTTAIDTMQQQ